MIYIKTKSQTYTFNCLALLSSDGHCLWHATSQLPQYVPEVEQVSENGQMIP